MARRAAFVGQAVAGAAARSGGSGVPAGCGGSGVTPGPGGVGVGTGAASPEAEGVEVATGGVADVAIGRLIGRRAARRVHGAMPLVELLPERVDRAGHDGRLGGGRAGGAASPGEVADRRAYRSADQQEQERGGGREAGPTGHDAGCGEADPAQRSHGDRAAGAVG